MNPVEAASPSTSSSAAGRSSRPRGSVRADLAVEGGRISAIEPDLSGLAAGARGRRRRRACSSCPGSSTSTPTPGSPRTPSRIASSRIRSRPRSAGRRRSSPSTTRARARRRPPSARSSPAWPSGAPRPRRTRRSITRSAWRSAAGWTIRSASCPRSSMRACRRPRRSWSSTSGSTIERLFEAIRTMGRRGGRLEVHCEDPVLIDTAVAAALARGDVAPRFHASSRPALAEAIATARAHGLRRGGRRAGPRRPPVVARGAGGGTRRPAARRPRVGRDLSPLPGPDRRSLPRSRRCRSRQGRHLSARSARRPIATRCGRAWPTARSTWSRPTTSRTGSPWRSGSPGVSVRPRSATVRRGSRRSWRSPGRRAWHAAGSPAERLVEVLSAAPARLFGLGSKGVLEPGRDADLVLFDPSARRVDARRRPAPHLATTPRSRAFR